MYDTSYSYLVKNLKQLKVTIASLKSKVGNENTEKDYSPLVIKFNYTFQVTVQQVKEPEKKPRKRARVSKPTKISLMLKSSLPPRARDTLAWEEEPETKKRLLEAMEVPFPDDNDLDEEVSQDVEVKISCLQGLSASFSR